MDTYFKNIDKQIEFNQGKNIFLEGAENPLKFIQETILSFDKVDEIDKEMEDLLIDYTIDKVLQEFCRLNQYYSISKEAKNDLRDIYVGLFSNIRNHECSIESISEGHYKNLKYWLQKTNPFAERIYSTDNQTINPVACSEYSFDLQINILQLDISQLMEPVLDIGCGKQGELVMHLRKKGIEASGFDRFSFDHPDFTNADWLTYEYGIEKWGTITSNLGFTNHFKHHHLREDGNFVGYAKTFMNILDSLKIGGCFHYAPDLPFIERYFDNNKYRLTWQSVDSYDFKSVIIKRLK